MESSTPQHDQDSIAPPLDAFHPPRPPAEGRFYTITVGKEPGVYQGSDDWHTQVDGIPGSAVRSFDSLEVAKQAYNDAVCAGLVHQVEIIGERHILTGEDILNISGVQAPEPSSGLLLQKWYAVYVGTQPGLYPGSVNISPLVSNVKGGRSTRWGSYEQAYDSFMMDLRDGQVIQDTTQIIRTRVV